MRTCCDFLESSGALADVDVKIGFADVIVSNGAEVFARENVVKALLYFCLVVIFIQTSSQPFDRDVTSAIMCRKWKVPWNVRMNEVEVIFQLANFVIKIVPLVSNN